MVCQTGLSELEYMLDFPGLRSSVSHFSIHLVHCQKCIDFALFTQQLGHVVVVALFVSFTWFSILASRGTYV